MPDREAILPASEVAVIYREWPTGAMARLTASHEALREQVVALTERNLELEQQIPSLEERVAVLTEERDAANGSASEWSRQVVSLSVENGELRARVAVLEAGLPDRAALVETAAEALRGSDLVFSFAAEDDEFLVPAAEAAVDAILRALLVGVPATKEEQGNDE